MKEMGKWKEGLVSSQLVKFVVFVCLSRVVIVMEIIQVVFEWIHHRGLSFKQ